MLYGELGAIMLSKHHNSNRWRNIPSTIPVSESRIQEFTHLYSDEFLNPWTLDSAHLLITNVNPKPCKDKDTSNKRKEAENRHAAFAYCHWNELSLLKPAMAGIACCPIFPRSNPKEPTAKRESWFNELIIEICSTCQAFHGICMDVLGYWRTIEFRAKDLQS